MYGQGLLLLAYHQAMEPQLPDQFTQSMRKIVTSGTLSDKKELH